MFMIFFFLQLIFKRDQNIYAHIKESDVSLKSYSLFQIPDTNLNCLSIYIHLENILYLFHECHQG